MPTSAGTTDKQVTHQQAQADQNTAEQVTQLINEQQQQNLGPSQQLSSQQPHQQIPQSVQLQRQACTTKQPHDRVTMTSSLDRTDFEKDRGPGNKGESTSFVSAYVFLLYLEIVN